MEAAASLAFSPWLLDTCGKALTRDSARVALSPYQCQVLHVLVLRAWEVRSKGALVLAGWRDIDVGDDGLERLVGQLRRRLDAELDYLEGGEPLSAHSAGRVPPRGLLERDLLGHDALTVPDMGWASTRNGELLTLAEGQFERASRRRPPGEGGQSDRSGRRERPKFSKFQNFSAKREGLSSGRGATMRPGGWS
jgi:hypothetical protein